MARRAAVGFIFVTVALDMVALGIIIPVLPKLVIDFAAGDMVKSAHTFGVFGTLWALMHFLFSPLAGALSDRFGRRPLILLSNFGLGLDYILMALAPNVAWLLVGRIISGITAASIGAASAYIADVTAPAQRARAFGMLGGAFGLGFVLGPALGGLLGGTDPRLPFWVAAVLSLANAAYGLFVLPESLAKEQRAPLQLCSANPVGALALLRSRSNLLGLASVSFFGNLAHAALPSVFVLYANYRYGWQERAVGLTLAGVGVCSAIVQAGLVGPIVGRLGERRAMLLGLFMGVLGFFVYGAAPSGVSFMLGIPLMSLWGLSGPAAQGLMTRKVGPTEQGRLQGAMSSLMGIAELLGPMLFTTVFALSIDPSRGFTLPGAAFWVASLLLLVGFGCAWVVTRSERSPAPEVSGQ